MMIKYCPIISQFRQTNLQSVLRSVNKKPHKRGA